MTSTRAFLAIPLPQPMLERLADLQKRLKKDFPGVRWSRPDNLHLTLRFFGDCGQEDLDKIAKVMVSVGVLRPPFEAATGGLGAFPSATRPRVFWLGFKQSDALRSLYGDLATALEAEGFPTERRPYTPHLTLGRARGRINCDSASFATYRETRCGVLPVERLVLFASELRPDGAIHRPLKTVFLGRDTN